MCEANLSSADQVVIFKGDFACLQAINLTNSTTGDLVFMGETKFLPVGVSSQQNVVRWNSLMYTVKYKGINKNQSYLKPILLHIGYSCKKYRALFYGISSSFKPKCSTVDSSQGVKDAINSI